MRRLHIWLDDETERVLALMRTRLGSGDTAAVRESIRRYGLAIGIPPAIPLNQELTSKRGPKPRPRSRPEGES